MIKINNATSENKPPWMLGENPGPTRTSLSGAPAGAVPGAASSDTWTRLRRALVAAARAVPPAGRVLLSWLAALPRRLGDRLFTMNDAEAYWRTWRITSTRRPRSQISRSAVRRAGRVPEVPGVGPDRGPAVPAMPGHGPYRQRGGGL